MEAVDIVFKSSKLVVNSCDTSEKPLKNQHFQSLVCILPWQINNTFIINENPPKMPYSASICRSLPTIFFALRLLNLSQNKQNAAKRGKLRT